MSFLCELVKSNSIFLSMSLSLSALERQNYTAGQSDSYVGEVSSLLEDTAKIKLNV